METRNDITYLHILVAYIDQVPPAYDMPISLKLVLSIQSGFVVAITTVYWSIFAGLKRYLGILTTLGACCGKHLTAGPVAAVSVTL